MRTSDKTMSPASQNDYVDWIISDRLNMEEDMYRSYSRLIHTLLNIPFKWIEPMDENLYINGLELRDDFSYETGLYLDGSSGLIPECSVFEMLVAMTYHYEDYKMYNAKKGNQAYKWLIIIFENLGFDMLTDLNWSRDCSDYIQKTCENFMQRRYKKNGSGGPFTTKNTKIDMRKINFWSQLLIFFDENV